MKKIILFIFINLILSVHLYCFDLIDDGLDFIEDISKLIGIVVMILAVTYLVKRILRDDNTYEKIKNNKRNYDDYDNNYRRRRRGERKSRDMRRDYYDDYYDDDDDYDDYNNNRVDRDKSSIIEENIQYEYDIRDYDRRERRISNNKNNNIESEENDSRYKKVYELKPKYKLKNNRKE